MPTVLITGANRGLGLEFAKQYAADGWSVIATCRNPIGVGELAQIEGDIAVYGLDVNNPPSLDRFVADLDGRAIDVLINNAGVYGPKGITAKDVTVEDWMPVMQTNMMAPLFLARALLENVSKGDRKLIVNISSIAGHRPAPCFAAYGTAKAALSFLTLELAQEFAPRIRVNGIAVGSTKTDALNTVLNDEIEQTMVNLTPMARLGEVEDIALGALYLCSPAASYVTGELLRVNGGMERLNMEMPRAWGGMG